MRDLKQLLRIAAGRNREDEYCLLKFRGLKSLREALRKRCTEDKISVPVVMEAMLSGFVMKHPSALQLVDDWIRQQGKSEKEERGHALRAKEISDVYAEIEQKSMFSDEEE